MEQLIVDFYIGFISVMFIGVIVYAVCEDIFRGLF